MSGLNESIDGWALFGHRVNERHIQGYYNVSLGRMFACCSRTGFSQLREFRLSTRVID